VSRIVVVKSASSQLHRARRLAAGLGDLDSIGAVAALAAASACCDCGFEAGADRFGTGAD